jgi:iron complex transport system substrate-binding protein
MFRTTTSRWRLPALLLAFLPSLVLTACGSGESAEPEADAPAEGSSGGAFPVTVEHKYGSTTIEKAPQRVITLGLSDQDAALALGVKPVGAVDWFKERPFGKWPWAKQLWGDQPPKIVGERDDYNTEQIAALEPDLILAQYSGMKQEQYDKLSQIEGVAVVAQPKGHEDYLAPWQLMTQQIGKALGKQDEVDKLITEVEGKFTEVADKHPEWAKETLAVADSFEAGKYSAFTKGDPKAAFFAELGFKLSPEIEGMAQEGYNVAELSAEKLDVLDVDRLIWVTSGEDANERIKAEPLYQKLAVSKQKRDLFVPYEDPDIGAAFSFNTVLSIPYALEEIEPLLSK